MKNKSFNEHTLVVTVSALFTIDLKDTKNNQTLFLINAYINDYNFTPWYCCSKIPLLSAPKFISGKALLGSGCPRLILTDGKCVDL